MSLHTCKEMCNPLPVVPLFAPVSTIPTVSSLSAQGSFTFCSIHLHILLHEAFQVPVYLVNSGTTPLSEATGKNKLRKYELNRTFRINIQCSEHILVVLIYFLHIKIGWGRLKVK